MVADITVSPISHRMDTLSFPVLFNTTSLLCEL